MKYLGTLNIPRMSPKVRQGYYSWLNQRVTITINGTKRSFQTKTAAAKWLKVSKSTIGRYTNKEVKSPSFSWISDEA